MRNRCRINRPLPVRALLAALLALLLPFAVASPLERSTTLRLIDSDPGPDATLRSDEPLYLRLRYRSRVPIQILVSGYYRGEVVGGFRQDSEAWFPAGNREATVWLAYPFGGKIDQVHVRLWNADKAQVAAAAFPIKLEWTGVNGPGAGSTRATKAWVAELTPKQRERMAEALSAAGEAQGFDPFALIFLCVPGYILLQLALTSRTSGGWRKATLAPAVIMVPILAYTVLAFAAQSNLWPLLLLLSAPLAFLYLVVLSAVLLLRRLASAA